MTMAKNHKTRNSPCVLFFQILSSFQNLPALACSQNFQVVAFIFCLQSVTVTLRRLVCWGTNQSLCAYSVASDYFRPHGLSPARLLRPWDCPCENTGGGCHCLLQGIFLTQGLNPCLLHWQANPLPQYHLGSLTKVYLLSKNKAFYLTLRHHPFNTVNPCKNILMSWLFLAGPWLSPTCKVPRKPMQLSGLFSDLC